MDQLNHLNKQLLPGRTYLRYFEAADERISIQVAV